MALDAAEAPAEVTVACSWPTWLASAVRPAWNWSDEVVAALGSGRSAQDLLDALDGAPGADPVLADHLAQHPGATPPVPAPVLPALGLLRAGIARRSPYNAIAGLLPRGRGDATWLREYGDGLAGPDGWTVRPVSSGGSASHLVASLAGADGYAVVPAGGGPVRPGNSVAVHVTSHD